MLGAIQKCTHLLREMRVRAPQNVCRDINIALRAAKRTFDYLCKSSAYTQWALARAMAKVAAMAVENSAKSQTARTRTLCYASRV